MSAGAQQAQQSYLRRYEEIIQKARIYGPSSLNEGELKELRLILSNRDLASRLGLGDRMFGEQVLRNRMEADIMSTTRKISELSEAIKRLRIQLYRKLSYY